MDPIENGESSSNRYVRKYQRVYKNWTVGTSRVKMLFCCHLASRLQMTQDPWGMQREKLRVKHKFASLRGLMDRRDRLEVSGVQQKHSLKLTNIMPFLQVTESQKEIDHRLRLH